MSDAHLEPLGNARTGSERRTPVEDGQEQRVLSEAAGPAEERIFITRER